MKIGGLGGALVLLTTLAITTSAGAERVISERPQIKRQSAIILAISPEACARIECGGVLQACADEKVASCIGGTDGCQREALNKCKSDSRYLTCVSTKCRP